MWPRDNFAGETSLLIVQVEGHPRKAMERDSAPSREARDTRSTPDRDPIVTRTDTPMTAPPPRMPNEDEERVPRRRLLVWGLIAVAIGVGLVLYFRYEPGIAPLYDKVH